MEATVPDAMSGPGTSEYLGWLVLFAQGGKPALCSRRTLPLGGAACTEWLWPSSGLRAQWRVDSRHVLGASLVAQWLRICLPMQGTRVQAVVWEDPTCRGATRPVSHNY